jgi:hypothetical protein
VPCNSTEADLADDSAKAAGSEATGAVADDGVVAVRIAPAQPARPPRRVHDLILARTHGRHGTTNLSSWCAMEEADSV